MLLEVAFARTPKEKRYVVVLVRENIPLIKNSYCHSKLKLYKFSCL